MAIVKSEKYIWNSSTNSWDLVVNPDSLFYIAGTGSTAGTWLGSHNRIGEYYDGLTIAYKIPIAGASTTTLNINGLGARTVRRNTDKLTTHLPANTVVILTYTTISSVGYWVWADYDANSNSSLITQTAITNGVETAAKEINALLLRNNFYLKSEADALLNGKADSVHTHTWAQVSGKPSWIGSERPSYNLDQISEGSTYKRVTQNQIDGWNSKQNALGFTPENAANKRTSIRTSGATNTAYVSELGVKTYVDGLIGSVYRPSGDWNASTNSPTLANNTPANAGKVYRVSTAGTRFGFTFAVGDKLAFNENGVISKWDNVDDVTSVNGQTGTVVLTTDDINQGSKLYVLQSEKNTWSGKQNAITGAATTITSSNLTADRVLIANASGKVAVSEIKESELNWLGYLMGMEGLVQPQLDSKVTYKGLLGTTDLNTLNTQSAQGIYSQNSNANATSARNYPTASSGAGLLRVYWTGANSGVVQEYNNYVDGTIYVRAYQGSSWSGWRTIADRGWVTANTRSSSWTPTWAQVSDKDTISVSGTATGTDTNPKAVTESILKEAILAVSPSGSRTASDVQSWAKSSQTTAANRFLTVNNNAASWRTNVQMRSDLGLGTLATSNGLALNDLTNVTFGGTPTAGQALVYGSGVWTNTTLGIGDISGLQAQLNAKATEDYVNQVRIISSPTKTLTLSDAGKMLYASSNYSRTFTIPPATTTNFPIGTRIQFYRRYSSTMTISCSSPVTINGGTSVSISNQYKMIEIFKIGTNEWVAIGSIT